MSPSRRHLRAFTLVEALAAIAVMMIVIPVVLEGFVLADSIAKDTKQTADATSIAQSQLERIIATADWQLGSGSGDEKIDPISYRWESVLSDYDAEPNVQTLTVTVRWVFRTRNRSLELTTVVYIPDSTISTSNTPLMGGGIP